MKRIFILAAMAAAALVACNKEPQVNVEVQNPQTDPTGHYVTKSVVIGNRTKSTASFADEAKINGATIFVYQKNNETGKVVDYDRKYVAADNATFDLYFSDQTVYTYSFAAWVNIDELTDEPVAGDILFEDELNNDLQMRGSVNDIAEADAETVTIPVTRYVGKVQVKDITLDWKYPAAHGMKTFKLLDIYVANAGDSDAETPVATYNVGGVYSSTAMDGFLYDSMNESVLTHQQKYETPHFFYAYDVAPVPAEDKLGTEVVIKASLDDEVMYYHFPIEPADNTYKSYSLTIKQIGAEDPLGELPEETIVVSAVTLSVEGWTDNSNNDIVFEK